MRPSVLPSPWNIVCGYRAIVSFIRSGYPSTGVPSFAKKQQWEPFLTPSPTPCTCHQNTVIPLLQDKDRLHTTGRPLGTLVSHHGKPPVVKHGRAPQLAQRRGGLILALELAVGAVLDRQHARGRMRVDRGCLRRRQAWRVRQEGAARGPRRLGVDLGQLRGQLGRRWSQRRRGHAFHDGWPGCRSDWWDGSEVKAAAWPLEMPGVWITQREGPLAPVLRGGRWGHIQGRTRNNDGGL